jgi:hypothetical protein
MINTINIIIIVVIALIVLVAIGDAISKSLNERDKRNGNESHLIAKTNMDKSYVDYD